MATIRDAVKRTIRNEAFPLRGTDGDYAPLLEQAAEARFVLLGEATHGSREFYRARAEITKRLIAEYGFNAVAVEADWPSAYRINRFVKGMGGDASAAAALKDFAYFPLWMWRNEEVLAFVAWLREFNRSRPYPEMTGFYGLDFYSLYSSIHQVVRYLEALDPQAAEDARRRYDCFDHADPERARYYGARVQLGETRSCEREVIEQLLELQARSGEYVARDGLLAEDEQFQAEQNARVVQGAERYYRALYEGGINTWNLRDRHMSETLDRLAAHLANAHGRTPRIVVWEHNSHVGDARATQMGDMDEINVGQLARQTHPGDTCLVGFTTFTGTVSAASHWDGPVELKRVRPALASSYEALLHETALPAFTLPLSGEAGYALREAMLERAIGVVYLPETERFSHYFSAHLPKQFDFVVHFDQTEAVRPLEPGPAWLSGLTAEHRAQRTETGAH